VSVEHPNWRIGRVTICTSGAKDAPPMLVMTDTLGVDSKVRMRFDFHRTCQHQHGGHRRQGRQGWQGSRGHRLINLIFKPCPADLHLLINAKQELDHIMHAIKHAGAQTAARGKTLSMQIETSSPRTKSAGRQVASGCSSIPTPKTSSPRTSARRDFLGGSLSPPPLHPSLGSNED